MRQGERLAQRQANWKTVLALALSAVAAQGIDSRSASAQGAGAREMLRAEQGYARREKIEKEKEDAEKILANFLDKIDQHNLEEKALKGRFRSLEERQARLQEIQNERDTGEGEAFVRERMLEDDAGKAAFELVELMREMYAMYPNREVLVGEFAEHPDPRALWVAKRVSSLIDDRLKLPPRLKEQMVLVGLVLMHRSD